jgi:gliding motility-associated lipoprotein GldH
LLLTACKQVNLFERLENIPKAAWAANYKPSFTFNISDTNSLYNLYVTVRHTNSYSYNNLWLQSSLLLPGDTLATTQKLDLQLANPDGWIGTGMDDIYEQRIKITATPTAIKKPGPITISLSQIMRQNPLLGILQMGVRVEKITP